MPSHMHLHLPHARVRQSINLTHLAPDRVRHAPHSLQPPVWVGQHLRLPNKGQRQRARVSAHGKLSRRSNRSRTCSGTDAYTLALQPPALGALARGSVSPHLNRGVAAQDLLHVLVRRRLEHCGRAGRVAN